MTAYCPYDCTVDRKPCGDAAEYYVNGHYACGYHLEATILLFAVTNEVGHRWATVQVLPSITGGSAPETIKTTAPNAASDQLGTTS